MELKIGIIGSGNVAYHLARRLSEHLPLEALTVWSPHIAEKEEFKQFYQSPVGAMSDCDLVIIAVSDHLIDEVQKSIPEGPVVVHTSGATEMDRINKRENRGVIYPLQTFSKNRSVTWENIPVLVEYKRENDAAIIEKVAGLLSKHITYVDSTRRKQIHLAAVFVNNFVHYILTLAGEWSEKEGLDPALYNVLIAETIEKFKDLPYAEAQTGPAKRDDMLTMEEHKGLLSGEHREVYEFLSNKIKEKYLS